MSTFLLLVGLALFVSGAAMYLSHAARHDPRWVPGSLFFPFIVPLYYRRHWDELHVAALVQAAGLAMSVSGLFMHFFETVRPDGALDADGGAVFSSALDGQNSGFVDSERALKRVASVKPGMAVRGRVAGRRFQVDRAEYIDGVLRLSLGSDFFPDAEIAVTLDEPVPAMGEALKRAIAPDTAAAPEVFLSWRDEDGKPVSQAYTHGYRLEVTLRPVQKGKLAGQIQIMLPDRFESHAAGDFTAATSHLRFKGDQVDPTYDHVDTLYYLGDEYLKSQYPQADIVDTKYFDSVFDPLGKRGESRVAVTLGDGRVGQHVLMFGKNEFGWAVLIPESMAATEAAGYTPVYQVMPPQELAKKQAPHERPVAAPRAVVERTLPFDQLGTLSGKAATLEYADGRRESGVLRGMRKERLVLEANKGGGVVEYLVSRGEVATVRMATGEIIHVEGATRASSAATVSSASATPAAEVASRVVAGIDIAPLMNKKVRVVANDGKATTGILRGVQKERLVVETQVSGGVVNYTVPIDQVTSISFAGR